MIADMYVGYDKHLKNGNVWRVDLELPMLDSPDDVPSMLNVTVDVVAPSKHLAQYIAATMYPDYESLCVSNEPLS